MDPRLDVIGYLLFASLLGSFTFWLIGYFVFQAVRYAISGPSEQLQTVGTSILDEPALETAPLKGEKNRINKA